MKTLIYILIFSLFPSCSRESNISSATQTVAPNKSVNQNRQIEVIPLERLKPQKDKIELPNVIDFGLFDVVRKSNQKNEYGRMIFPFYEAEINIGLVNEPEIGEKVTIIPLNVNLEPFQLAISQTEKKTADACKTNRNEKYYWETELERITDQGVLEIRSDKNRADEFPFDVVVVYPSVNFAKNLVNTAITKDMLPANISIKTIEAAIDLDNDGRPDLLEIAFCCSSPNEKSDEDNDCSICKKSFKKVNGIWKLAGSAQPC